PALNGQSYVRIGARSGDGVNAGLEQRGLHIERGATYVLTYFARAAGGPSRSRVILGRNYGVFVDAWASADCPLEPSGWPRHEVSVASDCDSRDAALVFEAIDGSFDLDQVVLRASDHVAGWRRDVVEATRALQPGMLRFGGSTVIYYNWKQGIGPEELRAPFL